MGSCAPYAPSAWRSLDIGVALRRRPPANRRERRALGTHAPAREAEMLGGAGESFPRSFEFFEIYRTFGTVLAPASILCSLKAEFNTIPFF